MKKKIRILHITNSFPTKQNSVAAIFLLNQLEEVKKYCDVKVIFPHQYIPNIKFLNPYHRFSKIPPKEKVKGIEVLHPKYFSIPRIWPLPKILNLILTLESWITYNAAKKTVEEQVESWKPDIIHIHGGFGDGLLGVYAKKLSGKPLFYTAYGKGITVWAKRAFSKSIIKRVLSKVDVIISQSQFLINEMKSVGIKKESHIIPMGAQIQHFKPLDKKKIRKNLNLPTNKKIILFVGHLIPRKGVTYLVDAMKTVAEKEKDILCLLIGDGYDRDKLIQQAENLNLQNNIKFLGQKPNKIVAQYANAADLFVLPSLNEGLPVVLCESLASGTPVVATNIAGTPELLTKDTGILIPPRNVKKLAEAILTALNKKWDRKKLVARGKEFSVPVSAQKLIKVYRKHLKT